MSEVFSIANLMEMGRKKILKKIMDFNRPQIKLK